MTNLQSVIDNFAKSVPQDKKDEILKPQERPMSLLPLKTEVKSPNFPKQGLKIENLDLKGLRADDEGTPAKQPQAQNSSSPSANLHSSTSRNTSDKEVILTTKASLIDVQIGELESLLSKMSARDDDEESKTAKSNRNNEPSFNTLKNLEARRTDAFRRANKLKFMQNKIKGVKYQGRVQKTPEEESKSA